MKNISLLGLGCVTLALAACQSAPQQYNGATGYVVESQTANGAIIAYTLAGRADRKLDENKLQRACQKVLASNTPYKLQVLSINEIPNPAANAKTAQSIQLGHSRTSFSLSETPSLNNGENYATRQALDTRPSTLRVVRYSCS
ncbi:hypothetical protein F945_00917 [Acinetobacter rudis CIP 110305]|uniref:Lipoprotein n=2 Tax=Acinetobacter rudis TaxID=632955 RepID=S3NK07_9GAMM|nr:hypothetical protein F945_00917 [Acinetobacter rudis CIP 110305]